MSDIPEWAIESAHRRLKIADSVPSNFEVYSKESVPVRVLAEMIAEHEEPPVDPLLIEAREIANSEHLMGNGFDLDTPYGELRTGEISNGTNDSHVVVQAALAALKRGIQLGEKK